MALTWWPKLSNSKSQAASRRRGRKASRQPFRGLQLEWLEDRWAPATHVWSGAASSLWSNDANWNGGSPLGDTRADLVFPAGAQNFANRNDLSNLNIQSITFSGSSYQIDGNGITLHQGMTVTSAATDRNFFQPNILLAAAQSFTVMGYSLLIEGIVSGPSSSSLTKDGPGVLSLENNGTEANTYAGDTVLSAGTLFVGSDSALGKGTLRLRGGTMESGIISVTLGNSFQVDGPGMIDDTGSFTFTGNGFLATRLVIITENATATTFLGTISGPGSLDEAGTGKLLLGAANIYQGSTEVGAGILRLLIANAIPNTSAVGLSAGATLDLNSFDDTIGSLTGAGNVTLGAGTLTTDADNSDTTFSGTLSGSGGLIKTGTGTFVLSNANVYTGGTSINSGTLVLGDPGSLGPARVVLNGGSIQSPVLLSLSNPFTISGSSLISGAFTFTGTGSLNPGSTLIVNTAVTTTFQNTLSGQGSILMSGPGALVLSAANRYSGTTRVSMGTLRLGIDDGIPSTSAVTVEGGGGRLDLNGFSDIIASLAGSGDVNLGNGILTMGDSSSTVFGGAIQGQDAGGLIKTGSGRFTLSAASPFFSGRIVAVAGTLWVAAI